MKQLLALLLGLILPLAACADEALFAKLKEGGYVLLLRHAATELIKTVHPLQNLALVTHDTNIKTLTGISQP